MSDSTQPIRIFISSPGDVAEERDGSKGVIEGLQRLYPKAKLQAVLWEELALPATASFQETIDFLLEREPIDIAVFILWSRLGSPLGAAITRADGTPYRSGTEREFDLMLAAFEQSGRKRPVILAYVRDDYEGFTRKLAKCARSKRDELIDQQQLAESFVVEHFHDAEGRNLRAYQSYGEPVGFIQRLRVHLRRAIDDLLDVDSVTWTEEPYRGLETFDIEHARIFYGREEETCDLLQRLRDQQQAGCAFVVLVGASGSGKSSLARAGVAANLVQHADDEGAQWRVSAFIPTLADQSLCHALVRSLAEVLPDLIESEATVEGIVEGLSENAPLTVKLTIAPAFARAQPRVRLLLILDQMEELWTDRQTTEEDRERFLAAIKALAESDHVAVLATLRSDFYHHAQGSPTFLSLKGERGHVDLRAPDAASIHRLITEPARLAGFKFEQNEQSGRSLDDEILQDASHDPNALPLLEYTLSELYRQRDQDRGLLTESAYRELGGVEGAIGKRAEETFVSLPPDAQAALDEILPLLVSVDVAGEQAAVRRRADASELTATSARKELTDQLVAARFLTTDREGETPIASLAHEALLRSWDRIVGWINANREQLRLRARVEQLQQRWEQQDRDDSLLLADGLPLDEGRQLLDQASHLLNDSTKDYINASIAYQDRKAKQSRRRRTTVLSTIAALLVVMIVGGVYLRRSTNATRLVKGLLQANTSEVPDILSELASYPTLARDELVSGFTESKEDDNAKLHAALALLGREEAALPYLKERLLNVSAVQFSDVRDLLKDHQDDLTEYYWSVANDTGQDDQRRFQAACALASYDPNNAQWQDKKFTAWVADQLVGVLPSQLLPWRNALSEVREPLIGPLSAIYRNDDHDPVERRAATDTLADYLSDADGLFDLLADANEKQFGTMFDKLLDHRQRAIELANTEVTRTLPVAPSELEKETLAMRQANAAVMLLRMDEAGQVWPLLKHSPDPRVRSYIIHWLAPRDGKADPILARYDQETDVTIKRALLLCLGEFELEQDVKDSLIEKLLAVYRSDPDAGLHAAAEWLLRQWKQNDKLAAIDGELQQNEKQLIADKDDNRQWYINTQGQTFVILDAGEFQMGSPETETGRNPDETLHRRKIGRRIAVATKEVTHEQWRAFSRANSDMRWPSDQDKFRQYIRSDDSPVIGMTWYEAAHYCNWLSEHEGIAVDQWCYEPNEENKYGFGMNAREKFWELSGYRLPTAAEWEYSCRAGGVTSRYYGVTESLLTRYVWYQADADDRTLPVASLKPNDFGLFDMQGNVAEWCYDAYKSYPVSSDGAIADELPVGIVGDAERRVLRGGGFNFNPRNVRSAIRSLGPPDDRTPSNGFRPARTYHLSP